MHRTTRYITIGTGIIAPLSVSAQNYDISTIEGMVSAVSGIINTIFPALTALAVFMIAWAIFSFIINAGDSEKRKQGLMHIIWTLIGVFLLFSIWGLVNILKNTFTLDTTPPPLPTTLIP